MKNNYKKSFKLMDKNTLTIKVFSLLMVLITFSVNAQDDANTDSVDTANKFSELAEPDYTNNLDFGMNTSNNVYQDKILSKGLFTGTYRPYLSYVYDKRNKLLIRGKFELQHFAEKPKSSEQTKKVASLEVASFKYKKSGNQITVGRSFFKANQTILFSDFADCLSYTLNSGLGSFKAMAMYSGDYDDINCALSTYGCNGSNSFNFANVISPEASITNAGKKVFAGFEYVSPIYWGQQVFTYGLYAKDLIIETGSKRYAYNPYYAGLGFKGYIVTSRLRYRIEGILQGGNSFNFIANDKSKSNTLNAWATLAQLQYSMTFLKRFLQPQWVFEFAMASGDSDKINVTNPSQTNTSGQDNAFYHFGAFSAGSALKPRLSNIQVYRLGFQFKPFKRIYALRNLGSQIKASYYRKTVIDGPTSDSGAINDNADIGIGFDANLIYNVRSDLRLMYAFGLFKPGLAYVVKEMRVNHLISLSLSF